MLHIKYVILILNLASFLWRESEAELWEVWPFGVMLNKHKGAGVFSGPHADPVYVFGPGSCFKSEVLNTFPLR